MSTILVVDDNAPSRQFLSTLLSYSGHRTIEAVDGAHALECIRAEKPDLVISDIQMPNMDGRAFVDSMRKDPAFDEVPVIFYTATFREREARKIAGDCGVRLVITKPAEPEIILRTVHGILGKQGDVDNPSQSNSPVSILHAASLQLSAMFELGVSMARERSVDLLLDLFCRGLRSIVGAEWAVAGLFDSGGAGSTLVVVQSSLDGAMERCIPVRDFLTTRLREAAGKHPSRQEFERSICNPPIESPVSQCLLGLPVVSQERFYGWVFLSDKFGATSFSHEDEQLAAALIAQFSVAYENLLFLAEQRRLEQELRQSHKIEAVGQLAGGIAHDFNNLLTLILGHSNMALPDLAPDSPIHHSLTEIRKAGERAAALTRQLLAFSRREAICPIVLNPNSVISTAEKMLKRLIGEDVEIQVSLGQDIARVKMDPGQLEQILLNLAVNARDAMPSGGDLRITTENQGDFVVLTVCDTGCGMSPEVKARVLEPFFTTKVSGTGLGLSTVFGIVQQYDGRLEIESTPGIGSTFRVFLPLTTAHEVPISSTTPDAHGGDETVLVVEDEGKVRELVAQMLRKYGYTVLTAASGQEAKRICIEHPGRIHLLLTDVVMPQMSGPQVRDCLLAYRPEMAVLFMSGYLNDETTRHGISRSEAALIQKPFLPAALAGKVRETLNADAVAAQVGARLV